METNELSVATWNTEWATGSNRRDSRVRTRLSEVDADLLVVTEGSHDLLPDGGYAVDAGTDWGVDMKSYPHRRKVILWSRWPLTDVAALAAGAGAGRVVSAQTLTPIGQIRVLAVCIPWSGAHVSTGRRDATTWSEHLECCDQIDKMTTRFDPRIPIVVAGDFNQRVPRHRQPIRVAKRLSELTERWTIHTARDVEHGPLIDHIASDLACTAIRTWPGSDDAGRLSDHSGVVCSLCSAAAG